MSKINRVRKENNFVQLDKGFLHNPVLSAKAKGVLAYILSLPDDWVLYKTELPKHFKDGRESINSALQELEENGYLTQDKDARTEKGKMTHHNITVYEVPIHCGFSATGKPQRENRSGKPAATNNDLTKNNKLISSSSENPIKRVFASYQENIYHNISGIDQRKLIDDIDTFGPDMVLFAIEEAVTNNKRSYKYMEAIMRSWRQEGVKTIEQAKARSQQFERNKGERQYGTNGRRIANNLEETRSSRPKPRDLLAEREAQLKASGEWKGFDDSELNF